jgi:hypothetical protein
VVTKTKARLEHDREKREPVFPRDKRESGCAEIMLKQGDEIMIRSNRIMIEENSMLDIVMLALGLGFFVLAVGYTYACERL